MKKFIAGFLFAAVLFNIVPIGAAIEEFVLNKADYKLIIKGVEYKDPDNPILNHNGTTYAPVRSLLTAAGLDVEWNPELEQAEIYNPTTNPNKPKSTPDGITEIDAYKGEYYISFTPIRNKAKEKGYSFVSPKYNIWQLKKDEDIILDNIETKIVYGMGCVTYDYYVNTIMPLLK